MALGVDLTRARPACRASITALVGAVDELGELELLASSRCLGWTRLDVVVHMIAGWQEMAGGLLGVVEGPATVDAASYWPAFADQEADEDPVRALMAQRRRTASYLRPASALAQLHDVAQALLRGIDAAHEGHLTWQGHVFTTGDFLTTWAVEDVVHHLDLQVVAPPAPDALTLARETVEALAAAPLPAGWDDEEAVLVGSGRLGVPDDSRHLGLGLPVLG